MFLQYQKYTKPGYAYVVDKSTNEHEALKEIVNHFKINIKRKDVFSRCMLCNCDEFVLASKLDMIRLKYFNKFVPDALRRFFDDPGSFSNADISEYKSFRSWRRFRGQNITKYNTPIDVSFVGDGTLRVFQTFYICEFCAKIYWDGSHYNNSGGRFEHIFNLYSSAESI